METFNQEFLVWFAGFWEGEGNLYVVEKCGPKDHAKGRCDFNVVNTKKDPLSLIQSQFGGVIHERWDGNPRHSTNYSWHVANRRGVLKILNLILPHLRFKRREVTEKLELLAKFESQSSYRRWYPWEIEIIKKNWGLLDKEITKFLPNRSRCAIQHMRIKLGLTKPQGWYHRSRTYRAWLEERGKERGK